MSNNIVNTTNNIIVTKQITDFAEKFKGFALKTAESIIEMGKVVHDAKNSLNEKEFEVFCDQVGYKTDSSTIRKLAVIGKQYNTLLSCSNSLPSSWTTMYHVARLTAEQIEAKIEEGVITPHLDGKNLAEKLGLPVKPTKPVQNGTDDLLSFKVDFSFVPSVDLKMKLQYLLKELESMKAAITKSANLEDFLSDKSELAQAA